MQERACAGTGPVGEPLLDPALVYDHSVGIAVIGGFVYREFRIPELEGKYVFGDFSQDFGPTGRIFYTDITGPEAFVRKEFFLLPDGAPLGQAVFGFGEDENGELYVLASDNIGPDGNAGVVYRIRGEAESVPTTSTWGLLILALLLMAAAKTSFRRCAA